METLWAVFQTLGIANHLLYMKRHQHLEVFTGKGPQSVVTEFSTNVAHAVVLSKSELL